VDYCSDLLLSIIKFYLISVEKLILLVQSKIVSKSDGVKFLHSVTILKDRF